MKRLTVIPGERVEVDVDPEVGFPVDIQIGSDRAAARIEKRPGRRGVQVTAWRTCPELGAGDHPLTVHDARGAHPHGTVHIFG